MLEMLFYFLSRMPLASRLEENRAQGQKEGWCLTFCVAATFSQLPSLWTLDCRNIVLLMKKFQA